MGKHANLKYQFFTAIEDAFSGPHGGYGADKHSIKGTANNHHDKIYSFAARNNLIDTAGNFCTFMKEKYPEIKMLRDINVTHINHYLESKTNVSQLTLNQLASRINSLERISNKHYHQSVNWHTGRQIPDASILSRRAGACFTNAQKEMLLAYLDSKKDCSGKNGVLIASNFGLRSSEITNLKVKDIYNDHIHIHAGKGGRNRDIAITPEQHSFLKNIAKGLNPNDRIIPIRPMGVSGYLRACCKTLSLSEPSFNKILVAKSSIHAMRKNYATNLYNSEIASGKDHRKAMEIVMNNLGHSADREPLFQTYCCNKV